MIVQYDFMMSNEYLRIHQIEAGSLRGRSRRGMMRGCVCGAGEVCVQRDSVAGGVSARVLPRGWLF
jgi:hypothetical protein